MDRARLPPSPAVAPRRPAALWSALLALAPLAGQAAVPELPSGPEAADLYERLLAERPIEAFRDGDRTVQAVRLDVAAEGEPRPVLLRYPDGLVVPALVDRTAVVELAAESDAPADEILSRAGLMRVRALMARAGLWLVTGGVGEDGLAVAARLAAHPVGGILDATPNLHLRHRVYAGAPHTPDDPRYSGQWYFQEIQMPAAWGITLGDPSVTIVVVDTGCDLGHPDLEANMDPGRDVIQGTDDASYLPGEIGNYHGTACAGLAAAVADNGVGIAGGCPLCRLRCVRLLGGATETVPLSSDVAAFDFALSVGAAVVSNSWGYADYAPAPRALATAINRVATEGRGGKGAVVLFAAGNENRELQASELCALSGVVCVGAVNNFLRATSFTNFGAPVDLVAPVGTLTTDISGSDGDNATDYTTNFGGTSSACPVAAGVAGLLASAAPDRTAQELTDALVHTTRPAPYAIPDVNGHDPTYGYGIIDPVAALEALLPAADAGPQDQGGGGGIDEPARPCGCSASAGASAALPAAAALVALRRRRARPRRD